MQHSYRLLSRTEFVAVLVLAVCCGCSGQSNSAVSPAKVPEDRSLTLDEYKALGVPDADLFWKSSDYITVAQAITQLAAKNPQALPRYQSRRSGKLFARITDTKHFQAFADAAVPATNRLPEGMGQLQALNQINKVYVAALQHRDVGMTELTELVGTMLHLARYMVPAVNEFAGTLNKSDPTYQTRMDGLDQMKRGLGEAVLGATITLEEPETTVDEDRRLITAAQATFPILLPFASKDTQQAVAARLKKYAANPKSPDLKAELQKLSDEANRAASNL